MYEEANARVALGEYDNAKDLYEKLSKIKDVSTAVDPVWVHVSYGVCLRKMSKFNPAQEQFDISRNLAKEEPEDKLGKILYEEGRLYLSKEDFNEAEKKFSAREKGYKVDQEDVFGIFYGYALLGSNDPEKKKDGKTMIDDSVQKMKKKKQKKESDYRSKGRIREHAYLLVQPYYHLAMGLAMLEEAEHKKEALELLRELTEAKRLGFECVKHWATASDCADFPKLKKALEFRKVVGLA